jgi:hypothetical protein
MSFSDIQGLALWITLLSHFLRNFATWLLRGPDQLMKTLFVSAIAISPDAPMSVSYTSLASRAAVVPRAADGVAFSSSGWFLLADCLKQEIIGA